LFTKGKTLSDTYPFDKPLGVHHFPKHRDKLKESCYLHGGVDVLVLLIDFEALENATTLTRRQRELLDMYYREGCTQQELADMYEMSRQTVGEHIGRAVMKLSKSYADMFGGEIVA
jgi:predicted DNA binding protein